MTAGNTPEAAAPLQVRQIRHALVSEFDGLISMGDVKQTGVHRDLVFLNRALAAKAVRILTNSTAREAASAVTDGFDDFGIDAVAVSSATGELWLVQSKWSDRGAARFTSTDTSKLVGAFRALDNGQFDRFNPRIQAHADAVHRVLAHPQPRVHLVAAIMGPARLTGSSLQLMYEESADLGTVSDLRVLASSDLYAAIRRDLAPQPLAVAVTFADGWYRQDLPYAAYVGTVSAEEIAHWYELHGGDLFAANVRRSLGRSTVNTTLDGSLAESPGHFWYLNNGITLLCDSASAEYFGPRTRGAPMRLNLTGAGIVNGAQTAASLYRAFADDAKALAEVKVMVRVIAVGEAPAGFAGAVTVATNTQNHVEPRDFIALDPVQALIRDDFRLTLDKDYIVQRGDLEPAPESGCTVLEAATALACAHPDVRMAASTRASTDFLWQTSPDGGYTQLFAEPPSAVQIWRSVQLLRAVQQAVHDLAAALSGRAAVIAESGVLLIAHIVFQSVNTEAIDDPDTDWQPVLAKTLELTARVLTHLVAEVDGQFGPRSFVSRTFTQTPACLSLTAGVMAAMGEDRHRPDLAVYEKRPASRRTRRPSSVRLLVDQRRLPDGTQLMYHPRPREDEAIGDWLNADPNRFMATWTNDVAKPMRWEADGGRYSLNGLVMEMWRQAAWDGAPVAVNAATQWGLPGGPTLNELAEEIWQASQAEEAHADETGGAAREDGASGA